MNDNEYDEVGAGLRRLVDNDPLGPIDSGALLARGRRGRRRRRLVSVGGVITGVAAIAVTASVLPNLGTATPEVAGTKTAQTPQTAKATQAAPDFTPVPGVPRGEAALSKPLPRAELVRRCKLRYPHRNLGPGALVPVGITMRLELQIGDPPIKCTIPGGDRPSAALVAAAERDPLPRTLAGKLRNCSVQFWVDLTRWTVMASGVVPGRAASLVAVSPSGRNAVACQLSSKPGSLGSAVPFAGGPRIYSVAELVDRPLDAHLFGRIHHACDSGRCDGTTYVDHGRVDPAIARFRIEPSGGGKAHDIEVRDGWFAIAWANNAPQARVTAYDRSGKVIRRITI